jgi:hypothetical protein
MAGAMQWGARLSTEAFERRRCSAVSATWMPVIHLMEEVLAMKIMRSPSLGLLAVVASLIVAAAPASAQQPKPNILVIMGDDIGYWNTLRVAAE